MDKINWHIYFGYVVFLPKFSVEEDSQVVIFRHKGSCSTKLVLEEYFAYHPPFLFM